MGRARFLRHVVLLVLLVPILASWYQLVDWWVPIGNCVAVSPDGKYVATGFRDYHYERSTGTVEIRQRDNGTLARRVRGDTPLAMAFSPGGEQLAIAHSDRQIKLWSVTGDRPLVGPAQTIDVGELAPLPGEEWMEREIGSLIYSPDGAVLAALLASNAEQLTGGIRGMGIQVVVLDPKTGEVIDSLADRVAVAATTNGQTVALFAERGRRQNYFYRRSPIVDVYHMQSGQLEKTLEIDVEPPLLLTADNELVARAKRLLRIWKFPEGSDPISRSLGRQPGILRDLQSSADWIVAVSSSLNNEFVEVRRRSDGRISRMEDSGKSGGRYQRAAFSPDGTQLAGVGYHGTSVVWDVRTGKVVQRHAVYQRTMAFTGCLLAATVAWLAIWIRTGLRRRGSWQPLADLGLTSGLVILGLGARVDTFHFRIHDHPWSFTFLAALLASQIAVWTPVVILGPLRWSLRAPALLTMVAIIWAVGFWLIPVGPKLTFYLTGAGVALTSYVALLTVGWFVGVKLKTPTETQQPDRPQPQKSQVSLVELMLWTGAVAAAVAPGRKLTLQDVSPHDLWQMMQVAVLAIAITLSAMSLAMIRNWRIALVSVCGLVLMCAWIPATVLTVPLLWPWWSSAAFFAFGGMVLTSFALLRLHGYRLKFLFGGVELPAVPQST